MLMKQAVLAEEGWEILSRGGHRRWRAATGEPHNEASSQGGRGLVSFSRGFRLLPTAGEPLI